MRHRRMIPRHGLVSALAWAIALVFVLTPAAALAQGG